ncbi:hypothetical protein C8R44DRAFT_884015 [Mycena epipterygia]|nr:hypothetical protein C8R44DRAFT_884015 [Mycena epipterygia]
MATTRQAHNTEYNLAREAKYSALSNQPDIPLAVFPHHIFVESDGGIRTNVDTDVRYADVRALVQILFTHMAESAGFWELLRGILNLMTVHDHAAKAALHTRLGAERDVERDDFIMFITQNPPTIIFKELPDIGERIIWGEVRKGEEEGATANELYMSMELLRALRDAPPVELTPPLVRVQRIRFALLFSITLLHEFGHCATKWFFNHLIITPRLPYFVDDEDGMHGEAGGTLEKMTFGFILELLWEKEAFKKDQRLWFIENIATRFGSKSRIIDVNSIARLQASFRKKTLWKIEEADLVLLPASVNTDTHVRRMGGIAVPVSDEDEDELDKGLVLVQRGCGRSGVGLGLGL